MVNRKTTVGISFCVLHRAQDRLYSKELSNSKFKSEPIKPRDWRRDLRNGEKVATHRGDDDGHSICDFGSIVFLFDVSQPFKIDTIEALVLFA